MRARRLLLATLTLLAALTATATAQLFGGGGEDQRGILESLISRALSTPTSRVTIGAVEGALSSDATVRDIQIADRDGVWLRLDRARIQWRRLALIQRRLEVDELEIGTLEVRRRPIPAESAVAGENQPLLPELPLRVEIKAFRLGELRLGEPLLGTGARVGATGSAKLGPPAEGLDLALDARRLDAPGTLTARLGLVPAGERLTLKLAVEEPADGIVARLASLPGLPPVRLDIDGQGTLDVFAARLAFDAGPEIGAAGSADLGRDGAARRLQLDLGARIAGLLPAPAAPVFAGETRLTGTLGFPDGGGVAVTGFDLSAALARLRVDGTLSADRVADLRITAENLPTTDGRTEAGRVAVRRLAFDGRVTGPVASPNVDATLVAEDARLPAGRLARLDATFKASAAGRTPEGVTRLALAGDARAAGVIPTDAAQARALGDTLTLTLRGTAGTDAVLDVETLALASPTLRLGYAGRLGSDELRGRATLEAASLRPFAGLTGIALAGAATIGAELEGTPRANRIGAVLDGRIARFATGIGAVDGAFGGQALLAGAARLTPTGEYAFENLRLTGRNAALTVNGTVAQESADLGVEGIIGDLAPVDARLAGRATLTGRVTGGIARPNIVAELAILDATALGRRIPRLAVSLDAKDVAGALDAAVRLDGTVDGKPARGGFRAAVPSPGSYRLDGIDLQVGSVALRGGVTLNPQSLASGRVTLTAANLDDLSPLLLARATGSVDLDVALDIVDGGQNAAIKADADRVEVYGISTSKADADLRVNDMWRRPAVAGRVAIDEARVGGERVGRIRLDAQPAGMASDVTLTAVARGFDLDARARVVPGPPIRLDVTQLGASRGGQRLALAGPATVTIVDGGARLDGVAMRLGSGRLAVNGLVGTRLDLRAEATEVPLSAAEIVAPGLGLAGSLNASARIAGTPGAPTGEYRARINGLAAPQTRGLGLPRIDVTASGRLDRGRATLEAAIAAGRAGSLTINGSLPAGSDGALDLAVRGTIDAGAATTGLLAAGGRRVTGRVAVDARVGGTVAAPQASGSASLAGGTFTDATQGIRFTDIRARLVARGDEVTIEGASARARNGGNVTASGRVRLDPAAGFPGEIRLAGQNAELVRSGLVTAVANLNLTLSGALAQNPRVAGRIDLVGADVAVPEQLPGTLRPLPGTRHVNPTRTTRARLALDAQAKGKGGRPAPAFDAALDLTVSAPGRIFVRGRGLNAELGGSLRLTGTLAAPRPVGAFELRRGTFQVLTTRLDFSRGRLTFAGDLTPELDFLATANAGGAAIQVAVSGPADDPAFAFTSSPDLPQDEVLSRLLFNSPSGQLSTFQALSLAQAAAQFSGGGEDTFEGLRRSLGLEGLDIGLGSGGGVGVGLQRAIGDRVSVGVRTGATPAQTGIGADIRVTDEIRVQGEFGATGGASLGIGAQYEW